MTKNHPAPNVNGAKMERNPDHPWMCWGRPSPEILLDLGEAFLGSSSPSPHNLLPLNSSCSPPTLVTLLQT